MLDFTTVLRSTPFRVLVGKGRTCLTIPRSLAKDISAPLYKLMNNEQMRESQDGLAIFEDVEEDTFVGFCEFAYRGDYVSRTTERTPEVDSNDAELVEREEMRDDTAVERVELLMDDMLPAPEQIPAFAEGTWSTIPSSNKKNQKRLTKAGKLWLDFEDLVYKEKLHPVSDEEPAATNGDLTSALPTTVALLYHAKLYLFAETYLIDDLCILCLRKLHADLKAFDLTVQTSMDILDLLEFAYTYTVRPESGDNELRKLVVHYAACKSDILKQNIDLRSLLEARGELACDLFYKI